MVQKISYHYAPVYTTDPGYGTGGGKGIGNTNPGLEARPPKPRHPDGNFIPQGQGIVNILWEPKWGKQPSFPVGTGEDRRDNVQSSLPSFPTLRSVVYTILRADARPVTLAGGRAPSNKEVLPVKIATPSPILPSVRSSPTPEGVGLPTTTSRGESMPDVTDFLRDLLPGGSDIFDMGANLLNIFGSSNPAPAQLPAPLPTPNVPVVQSGGGMLPPVGGGGIRVGCESDPAQQYVLKFSCGEWKWVKKRKRRRKRLATSSDIKDLSSLKGVLGGGKSFDLWIATHA